MIAGVVLIEPRVIADSRGVFVETWHAERWAAKGVAENFVQDNQSISTQRGTLRGLHLQTPPHAQGKLVRCVRGAIWDVAVDIRHGSPTFGQHIAAELTAENWHQLWIPPGLLHGFVTLTDDTAVAYKVTGQYARDCERGVRFDDPSLAIPWPVPAADLVLSDKDRDLPALAECEPWFRA